MSPGVRKARHSPLGPRLFSRRRLTSACSGLGLLRHFRARVVRFPVAGQAAEAQVCWASSASSFGNVLLPDLWTQCLTARRRAREPTGAAISHSDAGDAPVRCDSKAMRLPSGDHDGAESE